MNISQLPKIELHCHQGGIISPAMASDIRQENPNFPIHPDDFQDVLPVYDFDSFFNWWKIQAEIYGQIKQFYPILQRYIAQLKAQNVHYFELMIASGDIPKDAGEAIEALQAMREWVNEQEAGKIQIEFLVAFGRNKTVEVIEGIGDRILALYEVGLICGVAFAGPEPNYPVKPHHATFARFHDAGLGIEIHAGEWVGAESVWDALNYGFPDRIGHGVPLFQDPKLIELFQEKQIHIEMCPTSNLKTGSVAKIEAHPIRQARDLGLNFSVNTDDPGPFECSMNSEYELLAKTFDFTEDDFETIYKNSLAARFQENLRF